MKNAKKLSRTRAVDAVFTSINIFTEKVESDVLIGGFAGPLSNQPVADNELHLQLQRSGLAGSLQKERPRNTRTTRKCEKNN